MAEFFNKSTTVQKFIMAFYLIQMGLFITNFLVFGNWIFLFGTLMWGLLSYQTFKNNPINELILILIALFFYIFLITCMSLNWFGFEWFYHVTWFSRFEFTVDRLIIFIFRIFYIIDSVRDWQANKHIHDLIGLVHKEEKHD